MFDSLKEYRIQLSWLDASESAFVLAYGRWEWWLYSQRWLVDVILWPGYHARCWWIMWGLILGRMVGCGWLGYGGFGRDAACLVLGCGKTGRHVLWLLVCWGRVRIGGRGCVGFGWGRVAVERGEEVGEWLLGLGEEVGERSLLVDVDSPGETAGEDIEGPVELLHGVKIKI